MLLASLILASLFLASWLILPKYFSFHDQNVQYVVLGLLGGVGKMMHLLMKLLELLTVHHGDRGLTGYQDNGNGNYRFVAP